VKEAGAEGAAIGGVVAGVEFSDPKFIRYGPRRKSWACPWFIHPQGVRSSASGWAGNGWLGNTIGKPAETTIALSHLISRARSTLPWPRSSRHAAVSAILRRPLRSCCMVSPAGCNPK